MKYNETTTNTGIIQSVERNIDMGLDYISDNTDRLQEITQYANEINQDIWFNVWDSYSGWQYDDSTKDDIPIATTDLVASQQAYSIPSTALSINRVELADEDGNFTRIKAITPEKIESSETEFMSGSSFPKYYSLLNGQMYLYPASSYAYTDGLKVYFDRASTDFAYDDTTKTPGFASIYHFMIPLGSAIKWLKVHNTASGSLSLFIRDYDKGIQDLRSYYQSRFKDNNPIKITTKKYNFK